MKIKLTYIGLFIFLWSIFCYSENPTSHFRHSIDSIFNLIKTEKSDTGIIMHWTNLSPYYRKIGNFDSARIVVKKSIALAHRCIKQNADFEIRLTALKKLAVAYFNLGTIHNTQSDYDEAIVYYNRSLMLSEQTHQETGIVNSYLNIGVVYKAQGKFPLALDYYLKGLKHAEKIENKERIASFYLNIGSLYKSQNNQKKAKEYFDKSLSMALLMKDLQIQGACYGNLATLASHDGKHRDAINYYQSAMRCFDQTGDIKKYATAIGAIAMQYAELAKKDSLNRDTLIPKAELMLNQSIQLQRKIGAKSGTALELLHLGELKMLQSANSSGATKQFFLNKAEEYYTESYALSTASQSLSALHSISFCMFKLYLEKKNPKKALHFYKMNMQTSDSLFSLDKAREVTQYEMNYEFDQKQSRLKAEEEKQDIINKARNQIQKTIIILLTIFFTLSIIATFYIMRSLKITKSQSEIINQQKIIVEEKQKEILDSIRYAKKIQQTLLPNEKYFNNALKKLNY